MENQEVQVKKIAVIALTSAQILHETLDDLKFTNLYSGKVKSTAKLFELQLTKNFDKDINTLYQTNEKSARTLHESIEQIATMIATMDPYDIIVLAERLKEQILKENEEKQNTVSV